jgi:hypothetical protein
MTDFTTTENFPKNEIEFDERFSNPTNCYDYLFKQKWPNGFICKKCGHSKYWLSSRTLYICTQCEHNRSLTAGTIVDSSKILLSTPLLYKQTAKAARYWKNQCHLAQIMETGMLVNVFRSLVLSTLIFLIPLSAIAEDRRGKENQAQEYDITLGLFTRHVNPSSNTNETTGMLGFSYSNWVVHTFNNSYEERSFFGGKRFQTKALRHPRNRKFFVQGNLYAGLLQGYGDRLFNIAGVTVAAIPTIGFGYKNTAIEILYIPTPSGGVFASFLIYRF